MGFRVENIVIEHFSDEYFVIGKEEKEIFQCFSRPEGIHHVLGSDILWIKDCYIVYCRVATGRFFAEFVERRQDLKDMRNDMN